MERKLISVTELAEFGYCSHAWELKYIQGLTPSREAKQLQDLPGQPFYGKPLPAHALGISGKPIAWSAPLKALCRLN